MAFKKQLDQSKDSVPLTHDEILLKIEQYCAYSERCTRDVRQRLYELGADEQYSQELMAYLQSDGFVEDSRYALFFASGKLRINEWGKIKIRSELIKKQIPEKYIKTALDSIDEKEYEDMLQKQITKKTKALRGIKTHQDRQKLCQYLIQAGFEAEKVYQLVLGSKTTEH